MQTNNSFVKIIRKQQEKPIGFQPKAKANKPKHIDKRQMWSDTK